MIKEERDLVLPKNNLNTFKLGKNEHRVLKKIKCLKESELKVQWYIHRFKAVEAVCLVCLVCLVRAKLMRILRKYTRTA